jgi:antitoxin (DNA-binding transcriptional repressor) of toxin-antitoxin stability system
VIIVPVTRDQVRDWIAANHRHSGRPAGYKFAIGLETEPGVLVGVCVAGRPVARMIDQDRTLELTRVCTDGTPNACSMLIGAARRAASAMGYTTIITYTLDTEMGASMRAAGMRVDTRLPARGSWAHHSVSRTGRTDDFGGVARVRWIWSR